MTDQASALREEVRSRYAVAAKAVADGGGCCGPGSVEVDSSFGAGLYGVEDREGLPARAVAASLGCGNPTAVAELRAGERVLDLGSGGGIDVLLSARRVGPTGKVYGVDMTEEMLALALENKAKAGVDNVEFLKGAIEAVPLPSGTIDVVISNCVINLSVDKRAVFAEMFRVLAGGGRIGVSDVVADDGLSAAERAERGSYVGCIAGALSFAEYRQGLEAAGFTGVEITATHQVADGMHSAIVRAVKPADAPTCCGVDASSAPTGTAADPSGSAAAVDSSASVAAGTAVGSSGSAAAVDSSASVAAGAAVGSSGSGAGSCCGVEACCTPAETSVDPGKTVTEAKTASGCGCQS